MADAAAIDMGIVPAMLVAGNAAIDLITAPIALERPNAAYLLEIMNASLALMALAKSLGNTCCFSTLSISNLLRSLE